MYEYNITTYIAFLFWDQFPPLCWITLFDEKPARPSRQCDARKSVNGISTKPIVFKIA